MNTDTQLRVGEIMTANVLTVGENDLLYDAMRKMETESISTLPVVDSKGAVCGILSNSDLVNLAYNLQCDVSTLSVVTDKVRKSLTDALADDNCDAKVRSVMTTSIETVGPNATIVDAAQLLPQHSVHHLPVVDDLGIVVGIISTLDIVRAVAFPPGV